eukprot:scaffold180786_cov24-Tisochrysis_lutea.AAC.2
MRRNLGARHNREKDAEDQCDRDEGLLGGALRRTKVGKKQDPPRDRPGEQGEGRHENCTLPAAETLYLARLIILEPFLIPRVSKIDEQQDLEKEEEERRVADDTSRDARKKTLANQKPRCALAPACVVPAVKSANVPKKAARTKEKR